MINDYSRGEGLKNLLSGIQKNKFLRISINIIIARKINIVTFYLIEEYQIPRI